MINEGFCHRISLIISDRLKFQKEHIYIKFLKLLIIKINHL